MDRSCNCGFTDSCKCKRGHRGHRGHSGERGKRGLQGATGLQGQGSTGLQGNTGLQGATGLQGVTGLQGATGLQGNTGPTVPNVASYAMVTNTSSQSLTACGQPIIFRTLCLINSGIAFTAPSSTLTIVTPGIYEANYTVTASTATLTPGYLSFRLQQNGTPIPGSMYYSGTQNSFLSSPLTLIAPPVLIAGGTKFNGAAGDVITLVNNTNDTTVTLNQIPTGTAVTTGNSAFNQAQGVASVTSPAITVNNGNSVYVGIQMLINNGQIITSVVDSQSNNFAFVQSSIDDSEFYFTAIYFFDGVTADAGYTVTANINPIGDIAIEVTQIIGAATPSLQNQPQPGLNNGTGTIVSVTQNTVEPGQLTLMSAVAPGDGTSGDVSYSPIAPTNTIALAAGPTIAGGYFSQPANPSDTTILSANITGTTGPVNWAAVSVAILPAIIPYFCTTPVNASLDLNLIALS